MLLITAAIWGFAFVAQRAGMSHMGPFLFNGLRFALGTSVLLPLAMFRRKRLSKESYPIPIRSGVLAGLVLFGGASLQQVGLVYTTAGNAGFITGLYVVLVPVLGIFRGRWPGTRTWTAASLSVLGMFLLSGAGSSRMTGGDLIVLAGALFWAMHIRLVEKVMKVHRAIPLAVVQFSTCSLLSLLTALVFEELSVPSVTKAWAPLLYGGVMSVGIAYTLQVAAQKKARAAHAAVIMSLEAVFAMLGGWLILGETVVLQGIIGAIIMLSAMIISSLRRTGSGSGGRVAVTDIRVL